MQPIRGAVVLSLLVTLSGCKTPFSMGDAADSDARYGLKPGGGGSSQLDSDNVHAGQQAPSSPARETVEARSESPILLKPFRSTQRIVTKPTPGPLPNPKPTPAPAAKPKPSPKPKLAPVVEESPIHEDAPQNEPTATVPTEKPPFASPVPGKKGYVTSPFSPAAGFIDVTGLDPGSEAKDPYTGKVFRVP